MEFAGLELIEEMMKVYKNLSCPSCGQIQGIRLLIEGKTSISLEIEKGELKIPEEFLVEDRLDSPSFEEDGLILSLFGDGDTSRVCLFAEGSCKINCPRCKQLIDLKDISSIGYDNENK